MNNEFKYVIIVIASLLFRLCSVSRVFAPGTEVGILLLPLIYIWYYPHHLLFACISIFVIYNLGLEIYEKVFVKKNNKC